MDLMNKALSVPEDVRYELCDMGFYNDAMKGYMIVALRNAGFSESEIRKAVLGMRKALDEKTARDAEEVYVNG